MKYIIVLSLLLSCSNEKKIIIYKQWHLDSKVDTLDVLKSQKLPQAKNQVAIYKEVEKEILKGVEKLHFLSEGCEGDAKKAFQRKYNGWNVESLKKRIASPHFDQVLAPVGMKLLAKYPNAIEVHCGDKDELIQKHLLVYSNIRGSLSYYLKLKSLDEESSAYAAYLKSLKELNPGEDLSRPLSFLKRNILVSLAKFEELLYERNKYFVKKTANLSGTVFIVIGGLHTKDLEGKFLDLKYSTQLYTPDGYNDRDDQLISSLKKIIVDDESLILFSVPAKFSLKRFPLSHRFKLDELMSKKEEALLRKKMKEQGLDFDLLLSDFDRDGIRDFTLSSSGNSTVLAAEDPDWDNDGVMNLLDSSVGKAKVASVLGHEFEDFYESSLNTKKILLGLKNRQVDLVTLERGLKHNTSVLNIFLSLMKVLDAKKYNIKSIVVKKPAFTYGKQVFFSFNKATSSLEYYPVLFKTYLRKKRLEYKGLSNEQFYNRYTKFVLLHSMAHELMHSRDFDINSIASDNDWSISSLPVNNKYLLLGRLKSKLRASEITKKSYKNKSYKWWLSEHKRYILTINKLLRKGGDYLSLVRSTPWYTGSKTKIKEYQVSFLNYHNLVSIYSTHSPSEWLAETLSMCVFNRVVSKISTKVESSAHYEVLYGINPRAVNKVFCEKFKL